jgi:alkyl sulfatase BDS1-like metallo-beta-lactamase superfamily hydrolase
MGDCQGRLAGIVHRDGDADASITVGRSSLNRVLLGAASPPDLAASGELQIDGDGSRLAAMLSLPGAPDPDLSIGTPWYVPPGAR